MSQEYTYYECHICTRGSQRCLPFSIPFGWMDEPAGNCATGKTVSRMTCAECVKGALKTEFLKRRSG